MEFPSAASHHHCSKWLCESRAGCCWTLEENKIFEEALALYDTDTPDRWHKVARTIPGKSVDEVKMHYKNLEDDVSHIEAGLVPFPGYSCSPSFSLELVDDRGGFNGLKHQFGVGGKRSGAKPCDQERKKGVPWTEEEHRQFLMGLKKYGKGDWRNISRNFVISRTPTQVASHAQKYFLRLSSGGKDKRRSSIHDITIANLPDNRPSSPSSQMPALAMRHSSLVPSDSTDQFSVITDSSQSKEAGTAFDQLSSDNLFTQTSHGIDSCGVKLEYQNPQIGNFHENIVGNHRQTTLYQL